MRTMANFITKFFNTDTTSSINSCKLYFDNLFFKYLDPNCNCWIAGGAIRSYFCQEPIRDIDIYFPSAEEFSKFKLLGLAPDNSHRAEIRLNDSYQTDNSRKVSAEGLSTPPLDLVKLHRPTPLDCLKTFDFVACCAALTRNYMLYHENFFIDNLSKRLNLNTTDLTFQNIQRLQKYNKKGYTMDNTNLKLMYNSLKSLNTSVD